MRYRTLLKQVGSFDYSARQSRKLLGEKTTDLEGLTF